MREAADEAAAIVPAAERFGIDPKRLMAVRRCCRPRKSHRNREPLVRRLDNVIGRRVTLGDFEMELLYAWPIAPRASDLGIAGRTRAGRHPGTRNTLSRRLLINGRSGICGATRCDFYECRMSEPPSVEAD